jgi:membrane associated rhomboid family serine protease
MAAGMRILYGRLYHKGEVQPGQAFPLAPISSGPIIGFTLIWAIVNIIGGISGLGLTDDATVVAWVAHLGGYLAGLFTIGLFDRSSLLDWTAKKRLT